MSNVSNIHAIEQFSPATSKPLDGQVLIVSRGNKKSGTVSVCASLPPLTMDDVLVNPAIAPHLVNYLDSVRAKILRKESNAGRTEISTDSMSVAGVAAYLEAEAEESGRLSKELITEFLGAEENKAALFAAFAIALKYDGDTLTPEQFNKLEQMHRGLSDVLSELSGTRTVWEEKKQNTARKYIECLDDSAMKDRLLGKLEEMKERGKKDSNVLDALGF